MIKKSKWKVIILYVSGATIFWLLQALNKDYVTEINHPVTFVFDTARIAPIEALPNEATLQVTSGGWYLLQHSLGINIDPIKIALPLPRRASFIHNKRLYPLAVKQLKKVKVNKVVTDTLYVSIQYKSRKRTH